MCVCVVATQRPRGCWRRQQIRGDSRESCAFSAVGRSCTRTRRTQSQRYSSPSATGAAFVVGPTPIPSRPAILLPRWTSARPHHPTTTPPGDSRAGSRTGPPLQSLVATVAGRPGAPRRPVLRPWRPAAAHPRVFRRGLGQPTFLTVFGLRNRIQATAWVLPYAFYGQGDRRRRRRRCVCGACVCVVRVCVCAHLCACLTDVDLRHLFLLQETKADPVLPHPAHPT